MGNGVSLSTTKLQVNARVLRAIRTASLYQSNIVPGVLKVVTQSCQMNTQSSVFCIILYYTILSIDYKGGLIFNAGYRGGRLFEINEELSLSNLPHLIIFEST